MCKLVKPDICMSIKNPDICKSVKPDICMSVKPDICKSVKPDKCKSIEPDYCSSAGGNETENMEYPEFGDDFMSVDEVTEGLLSPDCTVGSLASPILFENHSQTPTPKSSRNRNTDMKESEIKKKLGFNIVTPLESMVKKNRSNNLNNMRIIGKLRRLIYFYEQEIKVISKFCKNELFPTMKFLERSDPDLTYGGTIMEELFVLLNIKKETIDNEEKKLIIKEIFTVLTTHITARRSYVRETLEKVLISK